MSRFLYIFAFGTLLSVSYTSGIDSVPSSKSIIDEIRDDKAICPTPSFLYNSSYTSECTKIKYPSKPLIFSEENINTFLCLGLYDISYRICHYKSRHQNLTVKLPNNENELDLQLKLVYSTNDSVKFCENLESLKYSPMYNKIQPQVTVLNSEFMDHHKCDRICFDYFTKLNPLCSIWVWAAELLQLKKPNMDQQSGIEHDNEVSLSLDNSKTSKNNLISHELSLAKGENPILKSEDIKRVTSKPNERLPSDKQNASPSGLKIDHEPKAPSKDSAKTQASNTALSGVNQTVDSKVETKLLGVDETHENSHTKSETSIDSPKKKSEEPENSVGSPIDIKDKNPLQNIENTRGSIDPAITLSQNTDDQRDSEDFIGNSYDTEDNPDTIQDTNNAGHNLPKPSEIKDTHPRYPSIRTEDDSHFFAYFAVITVLCVGGYVGYHNKQKILAIVLEGRRSRGGRGRRRPNTASYRKLDCTLEEAVTSQCNSNVTHVIY